jgi:predicted phosphodiesterase
MEPPTIALRFRDTTPNVDTIEAHREIIRRNGAVWWGWWKKDFEESDEVFLADVFDSKKARPILIVDRSSERMFIALCGRWMRGGAGIDVERVPQYYQDQVDNVFGWFLLLSLEDVDYDAAVGSGFGDKTLILVGRESNIARPAAQRSGDTARSCILHLSDLHFGEDYAFLNQGESASPGDLRRTLTDCILEDIDRIGMRTEIAAIVVTGDFISRGNWNDGVRHQALSELGALRDALAISAEQLVVAPGNHDIVRYPANANIDVARLSVQNQTSYQHEREFRTFVDELVGRDWKEALNYVQRIRLNEVDLLICVLNSCTIVATEWTEYGYVGTGGLDAIHQLTTEDIDRPTFKFVALHHHLLPVADVEVPQSRGVSLNLDASKLLDAAQQAGVHVALHGHQHMPKLARYQTIPLMGAAARHPLHVISNGSTGAVSNRLPGSERNTYCLFRLRDADIDLWMRELRPDGKMGASLFSEALGVHPERPTT